MNRCADIYSVEYYLPKNFKNESKNNSCVNDAKKNNFKILVKDDVKNSLYLVDA